MMKDTYNISDSVIIVPVYNDPAGIKATLQSLMGLESTGYQVLVVDNNSTDETTDIIRTYVKKEDNISFVTENEVQSSYAARAKGIECSQGDIVAFLDADETVDPAWLETALQAMKEQGVEYLGCNVEIELTESTIVGRYNARTGFPVEQYLEEQNYAPTCALLVNREVFEQVGLFDDRLISGGDREFGERVHEAGYNQGYAEDAIVYHPARTTCMSLAKKNFRVGRGFCQKQRYYSDRYGTPGIPPIPSGPSGDGYESDSLLDVLVFTFLSFAMLACRGSGYYYEFISGKRRDYASSATN